MTAAGGVRATVSSILREDASYRKALEAKVAEVKQFESGLRDSSEFMRCVFAIV